MNFNMNNIEFPKQEYENRIECKSLFMAKVIGENYINFYLIWADTEEAAKKKVYEYYKGKRYITGVIINPTIK